MTLLCPHPLLHLCDQYIVGALTLQACTFPTLVSHAYDSQFLQTSSVYVGHKGRSMNKLTHGLSQKNNLLSFFSFGNSRALSSFTSVARPRTALSLVLRTGIQRRVAEVLLVIQCDKVYLIVQRIGAWWDVPWGALE